MPKVVPPEYPKLLTVAGWDKTKGLIARVKKIKTGVTEELKKTKALFDAVKWDELELSKTIPATEILTAKRCEEYLRAYLEKHQPTFKKLETAFDDLERFLKKKADEFGKDEKTKPFVKGVKEMAEAAHKFAFAVAWGTVSSENQKWIEDRKTMALKADKQKSESVKGLKNIIYGAVKAANEAKSGKLTKATYERPYWSEHLRGIGAQVKLAAPHLPTEVAKELLVVLKEVATLWNDKNLPDDKEVPARILVDIEKLNKFKAAIDKGG
jgi:hypothetical protein